MKRRVVVTTEYRGVFFGTLEHRNDREVHLSDARMCVFWSSDVRGIVGLASTGPSRACRISTPAPRVELLGVTSLMECTDVAAAAWEAAPWSS